MKSRAYVIVSGNVQGVFFRASTRDLAARLGVRGWVRNTAAGKVEAVFEGEREDVEKMVAFCSRGPPGAHVDDIQVERSGIEKEGSGGFEVRH